MKLYIVAHNSTLDKEPEIQCVYNSMESARRYVERVFMEKNDLWVGDNLLKLCDKNGDPVSEVLIIEVDIGENANNQQNEGCLWIRM